MKTILLLIILSLSLSLVSAQNTINTYDCEKNTYIANPQLLSDGSLIFTDNYASKIYRLQTSKNNRTYNSDFIM
jgi:hypothetical protein